MPTSIELFSAILAMDAYNRDASPENRGLSVDGLEVGNAVRLDTLISSAVSSGFFAATYLLEAEGKTIISFRGTDLGPSVGDLADDVLNGWFGGAGFAVAQLDHAEDYFALVGARNP